jgi:phospholipid/cholesterol/gamma-HCH transport system substrate-binding protein
MENKANYTLVGLFVVILGLAMLAAVLWLGTGTSGTERTTYYTDIEESVAGLADDAAVKYRGVTVGRVKGFRLDPEHEDVVRVELEIDSSIPIREDNVAFLDWQGITGVAFLNIKGGDPSAAPLVALPGEDHPTIPSAPSILARLEDGVTELIDRLTATAANLEKLTDEHNRVAVANILEDFAHVSAILDFRVEDLDTLITSSSEFFERSAIASERFPELITAMEDALAGLERASNEASSVGVELRSAANTGRGELGMTASELRDVLSRLDHVLASIERDPSSLVYGRRAPEPGPGENR